MMTLHGVDVYIWSDTTPDVPKNHGGFELKLISNRGTRIYPGPAPEMDLLDWPRCRFVSETEVTDADIDALVNHLTGLGFRWTKCQKLFREDGNNLYSEAY
ncbi:MAG: Isocitrate dehydrogenase [NADP] [Fimbriimonadaceae bacterium]|nr:Isocitrate dehydrogenase [NADP] [Fimbriimonadaceae bacterium]